MPKALPATCVGSIVTVDGVPVPSAVILGEGIGSSSGYAIFDDDRVYYVPKTTPDFKTALTAINNMITNICAVLSGHDAAFSNGAFATIAQITSKNAEISALKEALK